MAKVLSDSDKLRMAWGKKVRENGSAPESFETFMKFSDALATAQGTSLLEAGKKRLNMRGYTDYARMVHKNAVEILKEEGQLSRLYRMGGKSAFSSSNFNGAREYKKIGSEDYHSTGTYIMGGVQVKFWSSDNNSGAQYIEYVGSGKTYQWQRKGSKI